MLVPLLLACAEPVPSDDVAVAVAEKRRPTPTSSVASWPASKRAVQLGGGLPAVYEASGAFWHPVRGTLLVVSDDGQLTEMGPDGGNARTWAIGGDLEAITVADPTRTLAYVGVERPDTIVEVDLATSRVTGRSWDLAASMPSADENLGLEALAFVPDGAHPYVAGTSGGLFYAGLQETGAVYVFDVDLAAAGAVTHVDTIATGRADLADLAFHRETGVLYALFDLEDVLRAMTPSGTTIQEYAAPGTDQEGVTLEPGCAGGRATIVLTEDSGPSVKAYERFPVGC